MATYIDKWLRNEFCRDIHEVWNESGRETPADLQEFMTQTVELLLAREDLSSGEK